LPGHVEQPGTEHAAARVVGHVLQALRESVGVHEGVDVQQQHVRPGAQRERLVVRASEPDVGLVGDQNAIRKVFADEGGGSIA